MTIHILYMFVSIVVVMGQRLRAQHWTTSQHRLLIFNLGMFTKFDSRKKLTVNLHTWWWKLWYGFRLWFSMGFLKNHGFPSKIWNHRGHSTTRQFQRPEGALGPFAQLWWHHHLWFGTCAWGEGLSAQGQLYRSWSGGKWTVWSCLAGDFWDLTWTFLEVNLFELPHGINKLMPF